MIVLSSEWIDKWALDWHISALSNRFHNTLSFMLAFQNSLKWLLRVNFWKIGTFSSSCWERHLEWRAMRMAVCGAHLFLFQRHSPLRVDFQSSPFSSIIRPMVCSDNSSWCAQKSRSDALTRGRGTWPLWWFAFAVHLPQSTVTWEEILSKILSRSVPR